MSDYVNIRTKPTRIPSVPIQEVEVSPPSPTQIKEDLKAAVIQMESIETSKYQVKEKIPRSPAPLPEALSPAGIPIDIKTHEEEDEDDDAVNKGNGKSRGEFRIDFGSYEVMDEIVDASMDGNKTGEYKRNGKASAIIIGLILLSVHLISQHVTMFTYVINYDLPDLILATILYSISSLCVIFLMLGMLVMPGLSINVARFSAYYGVIILAGVLDFMAVIIGGSVFSPLGMYSNDPYSSVVWYWAALFESIIINGILFFIFTRKPDDGKLYELFHPFTGTEGIEEDEAVEPDDSETVEEV